jgi:hypothetical protein
VKLEDAIQIRRSTARFESERLSLADFGHVLEMAHGHASLARSGNVDVYLVVHRDLWFATSRASVSDRKRRAPPRWAC